MKKSTAAVIDKKYKEFSKIFLQQSGIDIENDYVYYIRNIQTDLNRLFSMKLTLMHKFNCNCGKQHSVGFLNHIHEIENKDVYINAIRNPCKKNKLPNIHIKADFNKSDESYPSCFNDILNGSIIKHPNYLNVFVKHGYPVSIAPRSELNNYLTSEKLIVPKSYEICKVKLTPDFLEEDWAKTLRFVIYEPYLDRTKLSITEKIYNNILDYIKMFKDPNFILSMNFSYLVSYNYIELSIKHDKHNKINKYWDKLYKSEEECLEQIKLTKEQHNIIDCIKAISETKQRKTSVELSNNKFLNEKHHKSIRDQANIIFK